MIVLVENKDSGGEFGCDGGAGGVPFPKKIIINLPGTNEKLSYKEEPEILRYKQTDRQTSFYFVL